MTSDQELFDNAALGIKWQGHRAAIGHDNNGCRVLTSDGRRCALGHSVTDAKPEWGTSRQWIKLSRTALGAALVAAHDGTLACSRGTWLDRILAWKTRMAEIALQFGLDDSVLWFEEKR